MTQWWLLKSADGSYRQVATAGAHPSEEGEDVVEVRVTRLERPGNMRFERPTEDGKGWVPDLGAVDQHVAMRINLLREQRQMSAVTIGQAKAAVYAAKAAEVAAAAGEDLSDITDQAAEIRFPYAWAEARVTGDTVADVMARFALGVRSAHDEMARIEAHAQHAMTKMRAAQTASGKERALADFEAAL